MDVSFLRFTVEFFKTTCAAFEMFNATFYKMLSSNYPNILEIISNYCFL